MCLPVHRAALLDAPATAVEGLPWSLVVAGPSRPRLTLLQPIPVTSLPISATAVDWPNAHGVVSKTTTTSKASTKFSYAHNAIQPIDLVDPVFAAFELYPKNDRSSVAFSSAPRLPSFSQEMTCYPPSHDTVIHCQTICCLLG